FVADADVEQDGVGREASDLRQRPARVSGLGHTMTAVLEQVAGCLPKGSVVVDDQETHVSVRVRSWSASRLASMEACSANLLRSPPPCRSFDELRQRRATPSSREKQRESKAAGVRFELTDPFGSAVFKT